MKSNQTPAAIAEVIGERIKQARLNANLTQQQVADNAGITRKLVVRAEKGKTQLETMIAILQALEIVEQLDNFVPPQEISPLQLAKLQGQKRQRASGPRVKKTKDDLSW